MFTLGRIRHTDRRKVGNWLEGNKVRGIAHPLGGISPDRQISGRGFGGDFLPRLGRSIRLELKNPLGKKAGTQPLDLMRFWEMMVPHRPTNAKTSLIGKKDLQEIKYNPKIPVLMEARRVELAVVSVLKVATLVSDSVSLVATPAIDVLFAAI